MTTTITTAPMIMTITAQVGSASDAGGGVDGDAGGADDGGPKHTFGCNFTD